MSTDAASKIGTVENKNGKNVFYWKASEYENTYIEGINTFLGTSYTQDEILAVGSNFAKIKDARKKVDKEESDRWNNNLRAFAGMYIARIPTWQSKKIIIVELEVPTGGASDGKRSLEESVSNEYKKPLNKTRARIHFVLNSKTNISRKRFVYFWYRVAGETAWNNGRLLFSDECGDLRTHLYKAFPEHYAADLMTHRGLTHMVDGVVTKDFTKHYSVYKTTDLKKSSDFILDIDRMHRQPEYQRNFANAYDGHAYLAGGTIGWVSKDYDEGQMVAPTLKEEIEWEEDELEYFNLRDDLEFHFQYAPIDVIEGEAGLNWELDEIPNEEHGVTFKKSDCELQSDGSYLVPEMPLTIAEALSEVRQRTLILGREIAQIQKFSDEHNRNISELGVISSIMKTLDEAPLKKGTSNEPLSSSTQSQYAQKMEDIELFSKSIRKDFIKRVEIPEREQKDVLQAVDRLLALLKADEFKDLVLDYLDGASGEVGPFVLANSRVDYKKSAKKYRKVIIYAAPNSQNGILADTIRNAFCQLLACDNESIYEDLDAKFSEFISKEVNSILPKISKAFQDEFKDNKEDFQDLTRYINQVFSVNKSIHAEYIETGKDEDKDVAKVIWTAGDTEATEGTTLLGGLWGFAVGNFGSIWNQQAGPDSHFNKILKYYISRKVKNDFHLRNNRKEVLKVAAVLSKLEWFTGVKGSKYGVAEYVKRGRNATIRHFESTYKVSTGLTVKKKLKSVSPDFEGQVKNLREKVFNKSVGGTVDDIDVNGKKVGETNYKGGAISHTFNGVTSVYGLWCSLQSFHTILEKDTLEAKDYLGLFEATANGAMALSGITFTARTLTKMKVITVVDDFLVGMDKIGIFKGTTAVLFVFTIYRDFQELKAYYRSGDYDYMIVAGIGVLAGIVSTLLFITALGAGIPGVNVVLLLLSLGTAGALAIMKALESSIETVVKRVRDRLDATGYFSEDYGTISIRSYDHFYLTAEEVTALPTLQMGIDYKDGGYFNNIIPNSKYRQDLWDTIFSVGSLNYHDVDVVEAMKILRASGVPLNMIISILKDMDEDDAITSAVNAGMSKGPLEKKKIEDIVKAVNEHLIDLSDEENKNLLKQQEATGEATPEDKLNHIFNKRNRY